MPQSLVPKEVWSKRYDEISDFEETLTENNTVVLKFLLHISKDEQKKRLEERIKDPDKHWKLSEADFQERKYWDDFVDAYEAVLTRCNTKPAPWYIIPSNKKWFRNLAVSHIVVEALENLRMKFPPPTVDVKKLKWH